VSEKRNVLTRENEPNSGPVIFGLRLFLVVFPLDSLLLLLQMTKVFNQSSVVSTAANVIVADTDGLLGRLALRSLGVDDFTVLLGNWLADLLWNVDTVLFGHWIALFHLLSVAVLSGNLLAVSVLLRFLPGLLHWVALGLWQLFASFGVILPLFVTVGIGLPVLLASPDIVGLAHILGVGLVNVSPQVLANFLKNGLALLLGHQFALLVLVRGAPPPGNCGALIICVWSADFLFLFNLHNGMDSLVLNAAPVWKVVEASIVTSGTLRAATSSIV